VKFPLNTVQYKILDDDVVVIDTMTFCLEIAYKKVFCVTDFGMCHLEDLVNEVKDNKELVVELDKDLIKLYRKGQQIGMNVKLILFFFH
jgi:hypothetical protein